MLDSWWKAADVYDHQADGHRSREQALRIRADRERDPGERGALMAKAASVSYRKTLATSRAADLRSCAAEVERIVVRIVREAGMREAPPSPAQLTFEVGGHTFTVGGGYRPGEVRELRAPEPEPGAGAEPQIASERER
jgi:hypothetical protein